MAQIEKERQTPPNVIELTAQPCFEEKGRRLYLGIKRAFDVVFSLLAMVILSPMLLIVALLIKREDGGPVIYVAKRVGYRGRPVNVYKFRTMRPACDQVEKDLTREQLREYYREYKLDNDPRITKIGGFLRRSSIDELPQLLNILRGEMSVVGPRPLVRNELESKYDPAQQRALLSVRPGLTGLWQVNGRSSCTYESGERQALELSYIGRCSVGTDIKVLFKTVFVVVRKIGAK